MVAGILVAGRTLLLPISGRIRRPDYSRTAPNSILGVEALN